MTRYFAWAAGAAVLVMVGGMWVVTTGGDGDKFAQCRTSQIAGGSSAIGGPFTLVNESGVTVTDKDVITGPSLIYFGYTYCPDVCPLDNARNAEAITLLEEQNQMVKPIFISIDPERDTPEVLADFTDYMHPRMVGLTGSIEQVKAASEAYRTYFKRHAPETEAEDYYLVDHTTMSYLVFPETGFAEFFKRDDTPAQMADRIGCFIDAQ